MNFRDAWRSSKKFRFRHVAALWNSPRLCILDWSLWRGTLIRNIAPRARRIEAHFGESPEELFDRLPRGARTLLLHLDISQDTPFIEDPLALDDFFSRRGVRALNARTSDIRKSTLQALCQSYGLETLTTSRAGRDDELLIVKTNLNSGGQREQMLSAGQRERLHLPPSAGRISRPSGYLVAPRAEVPADVWNDRELVVERYVQNAENRFYRVYVAGEAVVVSQGYLDKRIRRMEEGIRRFNFGMWREGKTLIGDEGAVQSELLRVAGIFLWRFGLDYGAVDLVEDEAGRYFVVDVNKTPFWGAERQAGLLEHLRRGLAKAAGK